MIEQYLERLNKEQLIDLLKRTGVDTIVLFGSYNSNEAAIREYLIEHHSAKISELISTGRNSKILI